MFCGFDGKMRKNSNVIEEPRFQKESQNKGELYQKLIRVETCNGPLCAGKQASEYSIC